MLIYLHARESYSSSYFEPALHVPQANFTAVMSPRAACGTVRKVQYVERRIGWLIEIDFFRRAETYVLVIYFLFCVFLAVFCKGSQKPALIFIPKLLKIYEQNSTPLEDPVFVYKFLHEMVNINNYQYICRNVVLYFMYNCTSICCCITCCTFTAAVICFNIFQYFLIFLNHNLIFFNIS